MGELRRGGLLISKVHQVSGRVFARLLKEHGVDDLNPAQGRILFVLWEQDGISITQLAARTGLDQSTLTRMLDRLEAVGHVRRVASPADRRAQRIELTETHLQLKARYDEVSRRMTELFYRGFEESEIDAFEGYLGRVLDNLLKTEGGQSGGHQSGA